MSTLRPLLLAVTCALSLPAAAQRFVFEVPESLGEIEIPETLHTLGVPNQLHAARSRLPVAALHRYFLDAFLKAGLYVPPTREQLQALAEPMLTALDPATDTSYTVILHAQEDGTTTVVMGEAHLRDRQVETRAPFAPVFPGSKPPLQSRMEGASSMQYLAPAPDAEVWRFYRELFAKAGYQEKHPGLFEREGEQLLVSTQPGRGGTSVVVVKLATGPSTTP